MVEHDNVGWLRGIICNRCGLRVERQSTGQKVMGSYDTRGPIWWVEERWADGALQGWMEVRIDTNSKQFPPVEEFYDLCTKCASAIADLMRGECTKGETLMEKPVVVK